MCDDDIHVGLLYDPTVSRRTFGLAAVAVAGLGSAAHAQSGVTEKDVEVKTADGTADAALFYPSGKGTWPAVLIWTDIAGLRPAFRDMGRRLASQGYVVLVPNPFYRSVKGVVATPGFDFAKPEDRARVMGYRQAMTNDGIDKDAAASRIGAVGSFHGGGLTTKNPDSPHLLIPRTNASFLCCIAQNDDKNQPESKDILKAAFAEAKRPATVEVYPANHGWCVKGSAVYDEASAEKAWAALTELYKKTLV
jgi:carboxymethylenebutenolidase